MSAENPAIGDLAAGLERHQRLIRWLTDWCRTNQLVTSFSVGCSIGRGVADELSDVDAAMGVRSDYGRETERDIREVEQNLTSQLRDGFPVVDMLVDASSTPFPIRKVFVQFGDELQLDLAIVPESHVRYGNAAPDFVTTYRAPSAGPISTVGRSAYDVSHTQMREWAFLGWRALLDADKYLQRGALWEAANRLHEARGFAWRLWAAARGAAYPQHGLPQVFDHTPDDLPPNIEATVAGLDAHDLRRAVSVMGEVLAVCVDACDPSVYQEVGIGHFAAAKLRDSASRAKDSLDQVEDGTA